MAREKTFFEKSGKTTKLAILRRDKDRIERALKDENNNQAMDTFYLHHLKTIKAQIDELEGRGAVPW